VVLAVAAVAAAKMGPVFIFVDNQAVGWGVRGGDVLF
jgi:hypothetical protein